MLTRRHVMALAGATLFGRSSAWGQAAVDHVPAYSAMFETAFKPGFSWKMRVDEKKNPQTIPFKIIDGGKLKISSGQIAACDPFTATMVRPFTQTVPVGAFPIRLSCPMVHGKAGGRVAFARVDFGTAPIVRWQMAVLVGQSIEILKKDAIFGYPVDSGTGSFGDVKAYEAAIKLTLTNEQVVDGWLAQGDTDGKRLGLNFYLNQEVGAGNVIFFESGWGDGFYASYFGFDAKGQVTALLTDFAVID